jgi:hypothetical protein
MSEISEILAEDPHRDFPGRSLLISLCRIGHVAGLAGVSAWVLGGSVLQDAGLIVHGAAFAFLLVASGLGILSLDAWSNPIYFRQVNGLSMLFKLGLVVAMILWSEMRLPLFWLILIYSVAVSHAPGRIRHRRLL